MASQKTKFVVGLFIAGGIGIAMLAIIWLGMSRFFEKGRHYVTYFNESVQGLDVDSPVKYRGVTIGRVERIDVAPDSKLIQVVLKIESVQRLDMDIVAQLKSVGITGSMFVELDRKKQDEPDRSPAITFPSKYPILASKPSEISEILRGVDEVLKKIKALDLEGIADRIKLALDNTSQMIADANIKGISKDVETTLGSVDRLLNNQGWERIMASVEEASTSLNDAIGKAGMGLARVDRLMAENEEPVKKAIDGFKRAADNANLFLEKGSSLVSTTDDSIAQLKRHLMVTSQNLEKASGNLNRLIELLAEQPSQLLFGEPPPERETEPETEKKESR